VQIFINYRRDDTLIATGRIDDHLRREFGEAAVYRDIASIPLASDFAEHIENAVQRCRAMIVVIGAHWLTPRLNDEYDFVRIEIEAAFKHKIPVIPVLIDSTMPSRDQIPASIRPLLRRHGLRVDFGQDFSSHVARLIVGLRQVVDAERPVPAHVADADSIQPKGQVAAVDLVPTEPAAATIDPSPGAKLETELESRTVPANRADAARPSDAPRRLPPERSVTAPPLLIEKTQIPKATPRSWLIAILGLGLIAAMIAFKISPRVHECNQGDVADCTAQCSKKNAASCVNLGLAYAAGAGVAKDAARAAALYQQGCDGRDSRGCSKLGLLYAKGADAVRPDLARAAALYQQGCDLGASEACTELGSMYEKGTGVAGDAKRAAALYQRGCDRGNALGCDHLGVLYETGTGLPVDTPRAVGLYQQACEGGSPIGCRNLGVMFDDGIGVSKDAPRAVALYKRSCDGGEARGCRDLGMMYEAGTGTIHDAQRAVASYERGCALGDAPACGHLAFAYANGMGSAQERASATDLFRKACAAGYDLACHELSTWTNPPLPQ